MKHDPHTHKGEQEFKDAFRLDELVARDKAKKQSRGTPGPTAPVQSGGAPRRQSLLGSPGASRSTEIDDDKKKRRSGTLLMP